jgi:hypothetical protein
LTTAFGRMFVGAHLPLDLVGGAGLGMMVSAVARRLLDEEMPGSLAKTDRHRSDCR